MKKYTEPGLVVHLRQGDKKAFQHLYTAYYSALLAIILRIVKNQDDAEDLLQDTYVKVWQRFDNYDPQRGTLFTWLLNVARNTALSALSRRKVAYSSLDAEPGPILLPITIGSWPVTDTIGVEYFIKQTLNAQQWQVLELTYWGGYTHEETAERLALPLGTVKSRIRQSLIRLRPLFDGSHL